MSRKDLYKQIRGNKGMHSQVSQNVADRIDKAYRNFFTVGTSRQQASLMNQEAPAIAGVVHSNLKPHYRKIFKNQNKIEIKTIKEYRIGTQ